VAVALAVTNLAVVQPVWNGADPPEAGAPELTALFLNLDATNDEYDAVRDLLRERQPDVFAAAELTAAWAAELDDVLEPYSFRLLEPRESPWGLGLYSRRPLSDAEAVFPVGRERPILVATVEGRSRPIRLAVLHPEAPGAPGDAERHERFLSVAGEAVQEEPSGIVLGDLNTTPWSARFRELLDDAGLDDSREGYGLQTSWPSFLPTILRIPIDHVLVTPDLAAADRRIGPEVGSDHLPVWVELAVREE
jgi:endonuclease/exonuclease/phosphatase (EEP) superfamily protein YafD